MLSSSIIPGSDVPIVHARGAIKQLGDVALSLMTQDANLRTILLVTDPGLLAAGHADHAKQSLERAGLRTIIFAGTKENPTTDEVNAGVAVAREHKPNLIIGLGGGSSMDCAKGINFVHTNGGRMQDYKGINKAAKPMLPLIAIPTTAGTGSEAQSFALITDPETHEKMACGDHKALPKLAILDPDLVETCPAAVAAATGVDALSHAIETAACNKRNDTSRRLSRQAWDLLTDGFLTNKPNMLMGAHLAGAAIQNSMLGAVHSCANPLTAKFGITHGIAIGLMLPHVVRFNVQHENPYSDLDENPARLLARIYELLAIAKIPTLQSFGVKPADLPVLARQAALQWTAAFNPRPVTEHDLLTIYQAALL